jgi:predicted DNA-binding protein YlxM (UPF0122 family)
VVEVTGQLSNFGVREKLLKLHESRSTPCAGFSESVSSGHRSQHWLTKTEFTDLLAGYEHGGAINELAARYRISRTTVMKHLDRAGVPRRWRKLETTDIDRAKVRYGTGLSLAEVAAAFEVYPSTIHAAFRKAGVTMRDPHGRQR